VAKQLKPLEVAPYNHTKDSTTDDINTFVDGEAIKLNYSEGKSGVKFEFLILMLRSGVCSVEGSFRMFLALDD
jgi:hypothetical protein